MLLSGGEQEARLTTGISVLTVGNVEDLLRRASRPWMTWLGLLRGAGGECVCTMDFHRHQSVEGFNYASIGLLAYPISLHLFQNCIITNRVSQ